MSIVNIKNYIENNNTFVTSTTSKNVGQETIVGGLNGGGQVNADLEKQYSAGVFIGVDGHRC